MVVVLWCETGSWSSLSYSVGNLATLFFLFTKYNCGDQDTTQINPAQAGTSAANPVFTPYYSVAEICELPDLTDDFWTGNAATPNSCDADMEEVIRRIIGVLTTHGDIFTVQAVGYADGGEARLMAVVERVGRSSNGTANGSASGSRWRVLQTRWISD